MTSTHTTEAVEHLDVVVVGAGLSGISAAWHLMNRCPEKQIAVLEARETLGGTWDLFRYPGIRSDSDMYTLGFRFRPWTETKILADGPAILRYLRDTAQESGVSDTIRYQHKLLTADWSTEDQRWTLTVQRGGESEPVTITCDFFVSCGGYYNYEQGYTPEFKGRDSFKGQVIHPQHWPEDLDYTGKKVVVIGSGATAITLVPSMAPDAEHVTMLQRSPTYIAPVPDEDKIALAANKLLPSSVAYPLVRWKNVGIQTFVYQFSRLQPGLTKRALRAVVKSQLPEDYPVDTDFKPKYDPWDERLCVVPNGDFFRAIKKGRASVVTGHIDTFTENGIRLENGEELEADIIVTATGLNLALLGQVKLQRDGEPIDMPNAMTYKGVMFTGVPNFAFTMGYSNASWTLKADLVSEYVCRLLNHMDSHGYTVAEPVCDDPSVETIPFMDFNPGYVLRALDALPKQGSKAPWRLLMNYPLDIRTIRRGKIDDGALKFESNKRAAESSEETEAAENLVAV